MHATKRAIIKSFSHRTVDGKVSEDDIKLAYKIMNFHKVPKQFEPKILQYILNQYAPPDTILAILQNHKDGGVIYH